jgi:hypothetical protein
MRPDPHSNLTEELRDKLLKQPGTTLFHYTQLSTAVEDILPEFQFRLSPFSMMRDPRESGWWGLASAWFGDPPDAAQTAQELDLRFNLIKATFKVMSLTQDDPDEGVDSIYRCGFARPRLWEQYGGNHRGVCLCFDKQALIETLHARFASFSTRRDGAVTYEDGPIATAALYADLAKAIEAGGDRFLGEHLARHMNELFFKKNTDWATEFEYRFVVRTDDEAPAFVDVAPALRAVIVGWLVARPYLPAFRALCEQHDVGLFRLEWNVGKPILLAWRDAWAT